MIRSITAATALLLMASCQQEPLARGVDDGTVQRYEMTGTVVRLDQATRIATVKHERIASPSGKVWMEAMTMDFPVPDANDFGRLRVGAGFRATLHARESDLDYWIEGVEASKPD
jgi:Cu/Ag efflux protein CusF